MNKNQKIIMIILLLISIGLVVFYFAIENKSGDNNFSNTDSSTKNNTGNDSFEDAVKRKSDLIVISHLKLGDKIKSPLVIEGKARGTWFFEASFPIVLTDKNGNQIAVTIAQATSDWMTTDFVPFKAILQFSQPTLSEGVIIFKKDNPSGLPEHDDSLSFPIKF